MLVLKSLGRARADGDRIWGLVRGSAVNQNGTSAGLPVPNGPAQQRVIEQALDKAGLLPADVDYLEAHATGTDLGDSIELRALASVYGRGRTPESPLLVGSVKTNIGHAEWASGMASIIKAIMAMRRGEIPAHLHFERPNPEFDWGRLPVRVTSSPTQWPLHPDKPRLAAINSFGMSGANAHVILEGAGSRGRRRPQTQGKPPGRREFPFPLQLPPPGTRPLPRRSMGTNLPGRPASCPCRPSPRQPCGTWPPATCGGWTVWTKRAVPGPPANLSWPTPPGPPARDEAISPTARG